MDNNTTALLRQENREAPQAYEQIFESLPNIYLLLSPDFYIVNTSNEYLKATLTTREKIVGKFIFEAFPDNPSTPEANGVANVRTSLQQVLATRQPHQMERQRYDVPHPTKASEFVARYWLPTHTPILDQQAEIRYIVQHLNDVTNSFQMEAQLMASQDKEKTALAEAERQRTRLEKFLLEMPAAICIFTGPDFIYDFVNPRYQQQLFPGRDILGKPLLDAVPEVKGQPIAQVLQRVYQTGETLEGKEVLIPLAHADGEPLVDHYFNYIQQALYNEKGEIDGIMSFAYDITELVLAKKALEQREQSLHELNRKLAATNQELQTANKTLLQTQAALQQLNNELEKRVAFRTREVKLTQAEVENERARLEALFMQAPAPIVILGGPDLVYELVNPAYQQIFPGRELLQKPLLSALPEVTGTIIVEILQNVYRTGETFVAQEMPLMLARKDGDPLEEINWTFIYQARRNALGQVDGILVFAYEVTDQVRAGREVEHSAQQAKALAQELALTNRQLTRTNVDLDNFIYTASHDLKAPILNIEGLLEACRIN